MQTIIYKMDKQEGPTVWYRKLFNILLQIIMERNMKKEYI